jgi:putative flippase GtrA
MSEPPGRFGQLVRFALVGGSNTVVTLLLFVLLQHWLPAAVAYTLVFALGLAYTTVLTARVVFGARLTRRTSALYVGWYLLVYGVGLATVSLLDSFVGRSPVLTAVVTVAVTAPLNFLGGRLLFAPRRAAVPAGA